MKKIIAAIMVLAMILSMTACGSQTSEAPESTADLDGIEWGRLDPSQPIPADTGTVTLSPQSFPDQNLTLNLPEDVTASVEKVEAAGTDGVIVVDNEGVWKIEFVPYVNNQNLIHNLNNESTSKPNKKEDWAREAPGKLAGYDVLIWAYNLAGVDTLSPVREAVDIYVDYGEQSVGSYYGLHISLSAIEREEGTDIYEILEEPRVLAILNNFEVIETADKISYTHAGTTITVPSRWDMKEDTLLGSYYIDGVWHSFNLINSPSTDIQETAARYADEVNTYEFGGRTYYGGLRTSVDVDDNGNERITGYSLSLFTEFNEERVLWITLAMESGATQEAVLANLEEPDFVEVLSTIEIDPNGYVAPGQAVSDGFVCEDGVLVEYRGTDTEVVIPSEIGGEMVTAIGGYVFRMNSEITRVEMPDTIEEIAHGAFYNCTALETVVFSAGLNYIYGTCFYGCTNLKDVVLGDQVTYVGESAFEDAGTGTFTALGPTRFDQKALRASGFESIALAEGCDISADEVMFMAKASEVKLPSDLKEIGKEGMRGMEYLTELELPDSVTTLQDKCLYGIGLTRLNMPLNLETVGEEVCNSWYIEELVIPDGVTRIPAGFVSTAYVYYVNIPKSVTYIEADAIEGTYVVINSRDITMEEHALEIQELYLNGMYTPEDMPEDILKQDVLRQYALPMDATEDEMNALDNWLEQNGKERIAYYGIAPEFYDVDRSDYIANEDNGRYMEAYVGDKSVVHIPYCGSKDYGMLTWMMGDAFSNTSGITELSLGIMNSFLNGSFNGLNELEDLWINMIQVDYALHDAEGSLQEASFAGIAENVTIHYPGSITEEELSALKETYEACGMPKTVVYEPYSLRG